MKKINILHIASFVGNIGDNANHNGTRHLLKKNLPFDLEFSELEIREYFWGKRKFDLSFAKEANSYDLILLGGGNFFELWVTNSCNSTSLDIPIHILKLINTPMIFYSLGVDPAQGIADIGKFKVWLDFISTRPHQFILSVRNDGAIDNLKKYVGGNYAKLFHHVPDGGFFVTTKESYHPEVPSEGTLIGINLAGDIPEIRFPDKAGYINCDRFIEEFASLVNNLLDQNPNINLIFFNHIYKDIFLLSEILKKIKDWHIRKRITISPYLHGSGSEQYIFDLYKKCNLILGNRFHTNVCAIGLHIPSIGLINYDQIKNLYNETGLGDRTIEINKPFKNQLIDMIKVSLKNNEIITQEYARITQTLEKEVTAFHKYLTAWLLQSIKKK